MTSSNQAIHFPDHFPPTTSIKKFFIGVRWLGPDLSFFKDIKILQANRTENMMALWDGDRRQETAESISVILKKRLCWETNIFLPEDQAALIFHGPKFDLMDNFVIEEIVENLEQKYKITIPSSFWDYNIIATFGEIVDDLVKIQDSKQSNKQIRIEFFYLLYLYSV